MGDVLKAVKDLEWETKDLSVVSEVVRPENSAEPKEVVGSVPGPVLDAKVEFGAEPAVVMVVVGTTMVVFEEVAKCEKLTEVDKIDGTVFGRVGTARVVCEAEFKPFEEDMSTTYPVVDSLLELLVAPAIDPHELLGMLWLPFADEFVSGKVLSPLLKIVIFRRRSPSRDASD